MLIAIANYIGDNNIGTTPPFGGNDIIDERGGIPIVMELSSEDIITEN
tara:strand:- start:2013 stop:2156 length:144 start_codon:yes stop_codon:yes gene_type:complete